MIVVVVVGVGGVGRETMNARTARIADPRSMSMSGDKLGEPSYRRGVPEVDPNGGVNKSLKHLSYQISNLTKFTLGYRDIFFSFH